MRINGWDVLIYTDGTASLVLYGGRPDDAAPPAVPVGPLPAAEARRVADWLRRSGTTDTEDVCDHVRQLGAAGSAARWGATGTMLAAGQG